MNNDTQKPHRFTETASFADALGFYAINQDLEMAFYQAIDINDIDLAIKKYRQLLFRNLPYFENKITNPDEEEWLLENTDVDEERQKQKPNNTLTEEKYNYQLILQICDILLQKMAHLLKYMKEANLMVPIKMDTSSRPMLLDSDD